MSDEGRPIRCAVVVDSRNVVSSARRLLGPGQRLTWAGICSALRAYGFDPVCGFVGTGTRTLANNPSPKAVRAQETNLEFKAALEREGVTVLEGVLADRDGRLEEKQVDVLCAVKIADLAVRVVIGQLEVDALVVLSEDMDLMPAYELAAEYGLRTYAAASGGVFRREGQRDWLLLGEPAISAMTPPYGRRGGADLRQLVAAIATESGHPAAPTRWTVRMPARGDRPAILSTNVGLQGVAHVPGPVGAKVDLYATGVCLDPVGGRFPFLELSSVPSATPFSMVGVGVVQYWTDPTRVSVVIGDDTATLTASPGSLMPGDRLAVLVDGPARYLIGALDRRPVALPQLLTVEARADVGRGWHRAAAADGAPALLHARWVGALQPGDRVLASPVTEAGDGGLVSYMPLSTALPVVPPLA